MKMSRSKAQKGFTLIEVSLAIVIGVIILAGAITLYNQSKVSAGNSKATEKSLALASLVEEMAAQQNGAYPQLAALTTAWTGRRDDANASPWGGALGQPNSIAASNSFTWAPNDTNVAGHGTGTNKLFQVAAPASAGVAVYCVGSGQTWAYDNTSVATRSFVGYFVSICDNTGVGFSFANGGK